MEKSRFMVGIDLGTTNCGLAYFDSQESSSPGAIAKDFEIEQIVQPGVCEKRKLLPSFIYLPGKGELPQGALKLPWGAEKQFSPGEFAKTHGSTVPSRLVSSAKSWLCNSGVNRHDSLLPWKSKDDVKKISPVEAGALLLKHLADAWNHHWGKGKEETRLENQEIILTLPASFDTEARELTLLAAKEAGLSNLHLLEEPQAAFYSWLGRHSEDWREIVHEGDVILVIDVGGGTTDFSLIGVEGEKGSLVLNRLAVGQHILLGGDNMDLALAHEVSKKLGAAGTRLDLVQMFQLVHACRTAKETLLSQPDLPGAPVTILGRGAKVISSTIKTTLDRVAVEAVLVNGFFPPCNKDTAPQEQTGAGFQEIGLPFAADPGITRHLANFLNQQEESFQEKVGDKKEKKKLRVTSVLFNGGVFKSTLLQKRILEALAGWQGREIQVLENLDLDLAVARGAAEFANVRRGKGVRIRGGAPRTYYVGIESTGPAIPGFPRPIKPLCVVPFGMEEGTEADVPCQEFGLLVNATARFRFFSSNSRKNDTLGAILDELGDDLHEITPLELNLESQGKSSGLVPVFLHTKINDVGVLELWCHGKTAKQKWKLEFTIREAKKKPVPG
ncbi:MAG: Hsp70 family protein [Gemmataceae bacterium]|nr:Hsp70 family protein [Gemmataceae bacterium]